MSKSTAPWVGLCVCLAGCAVGPSYHEPKSDAPAEFIAKAPPSAAPSPDLATWWRALNGPELDSLVERAVKSNLVTPGMIKPTPVTSAPK